MADDPHRRAQIERLYGWLLTRDGPLPKARMLADLLALGDAYNVCYLLDRLVSQRRIAHRSGTRSEHRGHRVIRILATGRVLKTDGCPFGIDDPSRPIAQSEAA